MTTIRVPDIGDASNVTVIEVAVSQGDTVAEGDTLYDFCQATFTVCPEEWKERTEKDMARICDVDTDGDGQGRALIPRSGRLALLVNSKDKDLIP